MGTIWTPGGEHPLGRSPGGPGGRPPRGPGGGGDDGDELDDDAVAELLDQEGFADELAEAQARLAATPVRVVVANHAIGLFQLAALHLNQRPPSLVEGRLAIDALAAIVEGLGDRLGEEAAPLRDALSQARLAYVQLAESAGIDPASGAEAR